MNNGLPHAEGNRIRIHDLILGSGGDRALYTGLNSYGIYKYALD
ncbi:MAG: hypothetical protein U5R06_09995 [candidate division KSB1 bacterium]|nr:hypothetical protein [candidate division KSB1 bacterium]